MILLGKKINVNLCLSYFSLLTCFFNFHSLLFCFTVDHCQKYLHLKAKRLSNIWKYSGQNSRTKWRDASGSLWTISWQKWGWNHSGLNKTFKYLLITNSNLTISYFVSKESNLIFAKFIIYKAGQKAWLVAAFYPDVTLFGQHSTNGRLMSLTNSLWEN